MASLFSQNAKMKKSSTKEFAVYNFGIPAFLSKSGIKTCPNAGVCATGCYAKSGTYNFTNVVKAYESRLEQTALDSFVGDIQSELNVLKKKHTNLVIRIHDSGDFYSSEYWMKWKTIMLQNKDVKFYAYTKMISFFKKNSIPDNFMLIFSFGGKEDHLINTKLDRHSKVFETEQHIIDAGYINASQDDMLAISNETNKIGLVYHGNKNYTNTSWKKVVNEKTSA